MSKRCFVIQPFDQDTYDKRYEDIYSQAILDAGLEPYRIDEDLSIDIPIAEIHTQIKNAVACFVEITTDNPNVWYELGFAIALEKPVCIVCSDERKTKYPFDIQHRQIIEYKTQSVTDYKELRKKISKKLKLLIKNIPQKKIVASNVKESRSSENIAKKQDVFRRETPSRTKGYTQETTVGGHKNTRVVIPGSVATRVGTEELFRTHVRS